MADAVVVGTLGMAISMGAIVVGATLAGLFLYWADGRADHGDAH
ncbi:hypothetical protein [Pseudomaricurvus alkylphenolicus]|jgi:hypothetical protein|nr:hypothetical protein [Pseudomaricurvus alkylphenolicus]